MVVECKFKIKVYTFMGRLQRHDLERLGNCLELTLVEAADVSFHYEGRNRYSFNRIFLVISENGGDNHVHNHTAEQHLPMRKGMIIFMPGNTDLEFSFRSDMRFISFHFHLELFGHVDVFSGQTACDRLTGQDEVIDEFVEILNAPGCDIADLCRMRGEIMKLASGFINVKPLGVERLDLINSKYAAVFDYIRNRADATTGIDDLAEIAGVSRDYLSREFARDCGVTLKQYLNRNLIRRAERLLLQAGATARQVAEELHFNNEYYFSRFFKKHTGATTREYRTLLRSGPESS